MRSTLVAVLLASTTLCSGCARPAPAAERVESAHAPTIPPPPANAEKPADLPGLHNVVTFSEGLYSGSVPEGEEGFESLAALGIHTIISVDGAAPEVELAKKHGLRYVHLPITYGGFTGTRKLEIARAIRDLPGPTYVHCHHGKHRSAGAAGAAAVTLGRLTPDEAVARMKVSGTAPNYKGLYACAADAKVADKSTLDAAPNKFPEVSKTTGLVATMVEVDEINDHLKAVEKATWTPPADHPDLVPQAEAARLENLFRTLRDDAQVKDKGAEFLELLTKAANEAQELEDLLKQTPADPAVLGAKFKTIAQSCKECHSKYRD